MYWLKVLNVRVCRKFFIIIEYQILIFKKKEIDYSFV